MVLHSPAAQKQSFIALLYASTSSLSRAESEFSWVRFPPSAFNLIFERTR